MSSAEIYLIFGALAVVVVLQLLLLFRKMSVVTSPEQEARSTLLEQNVQTIMQSISRSEGAIGAVSREIDRFTEQTSAGIEATRKTLDDKLNGLVQESRLGRQELLVAFHGFETKVEQRLSTLDVSITARHDALQGAMQARLEESASATTAVLKELSEATQASRESLNSGAVAFQMTVQERIDSFAQSNLSVLESLKQGVLLQLGVTSTALREQLDSSANQTRNQFAALQDAVVQQLQAVAQGSNQSAEQLRATLNERLASIQSDNASKLEEMRVTVDEKLHATLEQRLGDSFKLVSERLELVHSGLGEMKTLAGSVGDLKRLMSNVRARGTWGEVQLGSLLESILTADQYEKNVKPVPGSNEVVEFAVRMPGKSEDTPLWLPVDSKFPVEDYQRLMDAYDSVDKSLAQQSIAALESSIRTEAKKIATKYINPPYTTDFAVMFVPTEGLFAEVHRIPGLAESIQNQYRVHIVGPTNFAAMLNSLKLGFRTLAIEKRSSEVWGILGSVKTEFRKFGEIVESTKKSIDAAANKFTDLGRRTRAIDRSLQEIQEMPALGAPAVALIEVLGLQEGGDEEPRSLKSTED